MKWEGAPDTSMASFPEHPKHPERICWGCEKFCPADDMCCGNGTIRSPHPVELFGEDWLQWLKEHEEGSVHSSA
jgi:hypothetical protein